MNSISTSAPPPIAHHLKSDPDPPKKIEQAAANQLQLEKLMLQTDFEPESSHGSNFNTNNGSMK